MVTLKHTMVDFWHVTWL